MSGPRGKNATVTEFDAMGRGIATAGNAVDGAPAGPSVNRRVERDFRNRDNVGSFFGKPVANKTDDVVRWLIHRFRELFPEPQIGTRTIANEINQAAEIAVSHSTVQRVLRESKPETPPGLFHPRLYAGLSRRLYTITAA